MPVIVGADFMFPNDHHVYLHDTPLVELFASPQRAFSHGCIRVARPGELAEFVLPSHTTMGPRCSDATCTTGTPRSSARSVRVPSPSDRMLLQVGALAEARTSLDRALNTPLFTLSRTPVTLMTIVMVVVIIAITYWLSRLAQRGTRRAFALRGVADAGTIAIAARLASYAIVLLGLGVALQTIGVDLGALFAAGAFFAVALGFAMQNVAQNFVSGIILLTERTIKPGDVLQVEERVVRVTSIGLRATVARSRDEEDLIIPNATLVQNTVTNFTLRDSEFRLRTTVGVAYESDLALVMRVLRETAVGFPQRHEGREPVVLLTDFGDSSLNFEVSIWTRDPWRARQLRSELNEAIWWSFQRHGITIPFPQRDVHIVT